VKKRMEELQKLISELIGIYVLMSNSKNIKPMSLAESFSFLFLIIP
jgi:hypothetical protein